MCTLHIRVCGSIIRRARLPICAWLMYVPELLVSYIPVLNLSNPVKYWASTGSTEYMQYGLRA